MHVAPSAWSSSLFVLLAVVACSTEPARSAGGTRAEAPAVASDERSPPSPASAAPGPVAPGAAPAGEVAAGPPPATPPAREIEGLRITPGADGTIRIEGTDRWGGDATTTYESVEFLEPALPVLARSLTPAQVEGLTALVAELRGR